MVDLCVYSCDFELIFETEEIFRSRLGVSELEWSLWVQRNVKGLSSCYWSQVQSCFNLLTEGTQLRCPNSVAPAKTWTTVARVRTPHLSVKESKSLSVHPFLPILKLECGDLFPVRCSMLKQIHGSEFLVISNFSLIHRQWHAQCNLLHRL